MKKQKTKVKRKSRKQKSNQLFVVSSSCVGALVAVALLVNYAKNEESPFKEIAFKKNNTNLLITDTAKGSVVSSSNSVEGLTTTHSEVPKLASASMFPEVVAYDNVKTSEEVRVISMSSSEVPVASPQKGSD